MKRILLMVFKNILLVPVMWCKLCYYAGHVEKYTEQQIYKMLTFIVLRANKRIYRRKMGLCSFQIIRECMMYLQL